MTNGNVNNPINEQQWQYINSLYNLARGMGIDLLKNFLPIVIVFVGLPVLFYEKAKTLFAEANLVFLFISWIGIIISIGLGFIAFFLVFEGYLNFAHSESFRMVNNRVQMTNANDISNRRFNIARRFGLACLLIFNLSLMFLIIFIISAICECL